MRKLLATSLGIVGTLIAGNGLHYVPMQASVNPTVEEKVVEVPVVRRVVPQVGNLYEKLSEHDKDFLTKVIYYWHVLLNAKKFKISSNYTK